jgi:hypothetical protein
MEIFQISLPPLRKGWKKILSDEQKTGSFQVPLFKGGFRGIFTRLTDSTALTLAHLRVNFIYLKKGNLALKENADLVVYPLGQPD